MNDLLPAAEIVGWMIAAGALGFVVAAALQQLRVRRHRRMADGRPTRRAAEARAALVAQLNQVLEASARKDRVIVALEEELDVLGRLVESKDEALAVLRTEVERADPFSADDDRFRRRIQLVRRTHEELGNQLADLDELANEAASAVVLDGTERFRRG